MHLDIGKRIHPVDTYHGPVLTLGVSGGSGMAEWMPLPHAHQIAGLKPRKFRRWARVPETRRWDRPSDNEGASESGIELRLLEHPHLDEHGCDADEPTLVVGARQIEPWGDALDGVTMPIAEMARQHPRHHHSERSPIELVAEHQFFSVHQNRSEALHPAEVVDSVHRRHLTTSES